MTFNTGNNVPSTDPRDMYDNAENLDKLVNGADPFYADRKGVLRESWSGMENSFTNAQEGRETAFTLSQADKESRFQAFLVSSGYVSKGDYAANVVLEERNEYVAVSAATTGTTAGLYRPSPGATLPLTLTGAWATDSANLVLLGDDVLRQELASSSGSGLVGYDADETYAAGTAGSELSRLAAAVAQTGGAVVSLDSFAGSTDQEKLTAAFAAARLNKVAIWLPARQLEVTETLIYDTTGLGYHQGLQLFGAGQLSTVFVNKINNSGLGGPVIRLTSGTASADQQHGGVISGVGFIQDGAGTDGHGIEYHGTWHQTFERLYADGLTGAALRCINLYGDSDSSAHVNISNTRLLYCKGGAWSGDGGTGGISVHSIRDLYAVNCGELSGAQVIIDGCAHFLMEQCSVTGQGIDAPNVPLVKIKNTNLRSRTITVRGGEYGNNGGTHFEIAAVNTAYFGGFRQVRRVGENNSTKGFDLLDGSSLYRNVHIGPIELAIDSATPAWTWMSLGTGVGGNFTIDPPNNDSFAAGNVYYAGGGASRVSIRDTENFEMVSGFVKRVRSSQGTPGTVNLDISTGKWQQVEFLSGGAYTVSVPSGVRDGREFDLTIINTVGATVSFSASMKVTGFNSSAIETSATFRYDETSALWKQIGGWSA